MEKSARGDANTARWL